MIGHEEEELEMSVALQEIADGMDEECELRVPAEPPPWLDVELFHTGRQFAINNLISILMSNFRSLMVGMNIPNLWEVLVLTGQSETRKKAFPRYVSTAKHIFQFYNFEPWTKEAQEVFRVVNNYHLQAALKQRSMTRSERSARARQVLENLPPEEKLPPHPLDSVLAENIRFLRETTFKDFKFEVYHRYAASEVAFSQMDMALVQAAFIGSVVVFPKHFGAAHATEQDLRGYLHLWRVIGYYLGVKDSCNLAKMETLEEGRALLLEVGHKLVVPAMLNHSQEALHMSKVAGGKMFDYHLALYMFCYVHGYELKMLWEKFSLRQKCNYYLRNLIYEYLLQVPFINRFVVRRFNNWLFNLRVT